MAGRYWQETGQHSAGARDIHQRLGYLIEFLGKDALLTEVTGDDVAQLVAWRRGHKNRSGNLIGPFTVNDTTRQLRTLFVRAKAWGVRFDREPEWRKFWIAQPQERVRELVGDEGDRIEAATREDYAPFLEFAMVSGLRFTECFLRWSEVDWEAKQVRKKGKGDRTITVPITSAIREILLPLQGHHPEVCFTYVARYTRGKTIKGERYPLTPGGVREVWGEIRKAAGVTGFRFHDFRHNLATKVLRETGNLKLVSRMLNHTNITTTSRYAHVLDGEVADAMERVTNSRKKSRTNIREVS